VDLDADMQQDAVPCVPGFLNSLNDIKHSTGDRHSGRALEKRHPSAPFQTDIIVDNIKPTDHDCLEGGVIKPSCSILLLHSSHTVSIRLVQLPHVAL
jgi:hypothetical protein